MIDSYSRLKNAREGIGSICHAIHHRNGAVAIVADLHVALTALVRIYCDELSRFHSVVTTCFSHELVAEIENDPTSYLPILAKLSVEKTGKPRA
jgi:hypothetical protein